MNLNVLENIKKNYLLFKKIYFYAKKTNLYESKDIIENNKNLIEDLFIIEIFGCFERFLRNRLNDCINKNCKFDKITIHLEYMKIDDILDSLKTIVNSNTIGYLKQIKSYRDWVAQGRNEDKLPPIKKIDFDKIFEIIKTIMEVLEKKNDRKICNKKL